MLYKCYILILFLPYQIDECLEIIHKILDQFVKNPAGDDDINCFVRALLRTLIQLAIATNRLDPNLRSIFAAIMGIIRCTKAAHYRVYVAQYSRPDLQIILSDILSVFHQFATTPVYPNNWIDITLHINTVIAESLHHLGTIIMDEFLMPFEESLWTKFFHCTKAFITQPSLQLERFDPRKQSIIRERYGDMRRQAVDEIKCMWKGLKDKQSVMVLELIGDFVEMSLIPEESLRTIILRIFFEIIECEWYSRKRLVTDATPESGYFLEVIESNLINHLDIQLERGHGDAAYNRQCEAIIMPLCRAHAMLHEPGVRFVRVISGVLDRLLEYRTEISDESPHNRMASIVGLLEYFDKHVNCSEMYIRYLDKLLALHHSVHNLAEAAFTMQLLGSMFQWSNAPLSVSQRERWPNCRTHRQLKEQLSAETIERFDQAALWECAIAVCKELADQFENETFDYRRLNETHALMLRFSSKILEVDERFDSQFFRVAFHGRRFPTFRRNQVFVYRGRPNEMLSEFCARLQHQHPGAELLQSMTAPDECVSKHDGSYILIVNAQPINEPLGERFAERDLDMPWSIRMSNLRRFGYSRPYRPLTAREGANEGIRYLRLQRTEMMTESALPGILPWSRVKETSVYDVSVQCAYSSQSKKGKKFGPCISLELLKIIFKITIMSPGLTPSKRNRNCSTEQSGHSQSGE